MSRDTPPDYTLGTELRSSAHVVCTLYHRVISPACLMGSCGFAWLCFKVGSPAPVSQAGSVWLCMTLNCLLILFPPPPKCADYRQHCHIRLYVMGGGGGMALRASCKLRRAWHQQSNISSPHIGHLLHSSRYRNKVVSPQQCTLTSSHSCSSFRIWK